MRSFLHSPGPYRHLSEARLCFGSSGHSQRERQMWKQITLPCDEASIGTQCARNAEKGRASQAGRTGVGSDKVFQRRVF